MIKKTFYNLPDEKRKRIVDAVLNEFSSASTDKVSINRIIKEANISRGSFYQYFDDKVDLVEVLIDTFINKSSKSVDAVLMNSDNDIFQVYNELFNLILKLNEDEKFKLLLKNLYKNIRANDDLISEYMIHRCNKSDISYDRHISFSRDNLKFKSDYDVKCLSQALSQILKSASFDIFLAGKDIQDVQKKYLRQLEIIKDGALAKE